MRADISRFCLMFFLLTLTGCATLPEGTQRSEQDPWERYNRAMYQFNDKVDRAVLRPVAKGYRAVTPKPVQRGVSNFFDNLSYPIVAANQLLQGNLGNAANDFGRFLVNTTVGIGGIFDPASRMGLERNNEDFGQTLGAWGVPSGPYVVLPLLGPSTVRDGVGTYVDSQVDPLIHLLDSPERYYLIGLRVVDLRTQLLDLDEQLQSAFDPYAFMRDAYLQRREYLVHNGVPPRDDSYYDDLYEDFDAFDDPLDDYEEEYENMDEPDVTGESEDAKQTDNNENMPGSSR